MAEIFNFSTIEEEKKVLEVWATKNFIKVERLCIYVLGEKFIWQKNSELFSYAPFFYIVNF